MLTLCSGVSQTRVRRRLGSAVQSCPGICSVQNSAVLKQHLRTDLFETRKTQLAVGKPVRSTTKHHPAMEASANRIAGLTDHSGTLGRARARSWVDYVSWISHATHT